MHESGIVFHIVKTVEICPYCGSGRTYLVQGDEHQIKEIEVV